MPVNTKCQVFTPLKNVQKLLDVIGYTHNLFGKKVAENSCGNGNILCEIVERYILDGIKNNIAKYEIKKGLENDIWAAEIDRIHILNCKNKLDEIAKKYDLTDILWNIFEGDFLKQNIKQKFDYVIGNPPYITYRELDIQERTFLRENFKTCIIGKFDYCYAFIEASIESLKSTGKLAYLIPSNIFKNQFALNLRKYILPYLTDIFDYTNQQLFTGKLTASSIIVCDINSSNPYIMYHNLSKNIEFPIEKKFLNDKWIFENHSINLKTIDTTCFGDYFHAASSIATLLNEVYIISDFIDGDKYIEVKDHKIEKTLLREAVSPRSLNHNKKEYIIFPYYYTEKGLCRYTEAEFKNSFPYAVEYLKEYKEKLDNRNNDKGISWFEYGRSQALTHLNQPKLLMSILVTGLVKVSLIDTLIIPTSGIYIIPKNKQQKYSLKNAIDILTSDLFLDYVKTIGIISSGNSFRITPRDINNFTFPSHLLK